MSAIIQTTVYQLSELSERAKDAVCDLARWLYRQIEREYDDLTSDASVDEAIEINAYTFTEQGRRFG